MDPKPRLTPQYPTEWGLDHAGNPMTHEPCGACYCKVPDNSGNGFTCKKVPEEPKPKKQLYCIAFTYRAPIPGSNPPRKKWVSDKLYVHADDAGEARVIFLRSENPKTMREINITGVAPAIGMFVEDNHGEILSAD